MQLKLVIDANILIAALIKRDSTADLLYSPNLELFAPAYLLTEVHKYKELIKNKAAMDDKEFERLLNAFKRRITLIDDNEILGRYKEAEAISPDEKDTPYIALALKLRIGIWSNDRKLKEQQDAVAVYNTEEIAQA